MKKKRQHRSMDNHPCGNHPLLWWPVICFQKGGCPAVFCLCFWQSGSKSHSAHAPVNQGPLCCPCTTGGFCFSECPPLTLDGISGHLLPWLLRWIRPVAFMLSSPALLRPAVCLPAEDLRTSLISPSCLWTKLGCHGKGGGSHESPQKQM